MHTAKALHQLATSWYRLSYRVIAFVIGVGLAEAVSWHNSSSLPAINDSHRQLHRALPSFWWSYIRGSANSLICWPVDIAPSFLECCYL